MKKITLLLTTFISICSFGQSVFINEIHYDNVSTDANEAIEIAGPAGTDLSTYSILLYNGNGNALYDTIDLSGIIMDQQNGYGTISFPYAGLQNGPDGIALVNNDDTVIQFLSYEDSFEALDGLAQGMTSTDIGVAETSSTNALFSLQLSGTGTVYTDFTWQTPNTATQGGINNDQVFDSTLSTEDFNLSENTISLYPNPVKLSENISIATDLSLDVEIYNALGALASKQLLENEKTVSTEGLEAGVYFVKLSANNKSVVKRMIIE